MTRYGEIQEELRQVPRRWLVTGAAGFIGSNIARRLLALGQQVVGLDNFSSGHQRNVDQIVQEVGGDAADRFRMIRGDIEEIDVCREACEGADYVIHEAAIGSVPISLENPLAVNRSNVDGFVHMLVAARDARVERFVYASSCALYGDLPGFPKGESEALSPLSPYATTKHVNELYAQVFARAFGVSCIGLRYFNVFGPRQDPDGAYAAVIPKWIQSMLADEPCRIFGDGETTRDFVYVEDVVQANLLAALAPPEAAGRVYNVGLGARTSLKELFELIRGAISSARPELVTAKPVYEEFRSGDVRHSCADISCAGSALGYEPAYTVRSGLQEAVGWYAANLAPSGEARGAELAEA